MDIPEPGRYIIPAGFRRGDRQMNDRSVTTLLRSAAAAFACLLLTACGTLPDVKPFADATAAIHSGMRTVGDAAVERMQQNIDYAAVRADETRDDASALFQKAREQNEDSLRKARAAFAGIVAAGGAFVDYADSLQGIVSAANASSDTVASFAGSVNRFATALTGDPLISSTVTSVASRLYKEWATISASRSLEAAMERATPIINEVAGQLAGVVRASGEYFNENARRLERRRVDNELKAKFGFDESFRVQVVTARQAAFARFSKACETDCMSPGEAARLKELDQLYDRTQPFAAERAVRMQKVDDYFTRQRALLAQVATALKAWSEAHTGLLVAVKENRQFNARQLVELAQDIRDIIRKGKDDAR